MTDDPHLTVVPIGSTPRMETDAEKTARYRAELGPLLHAACDLMNRASTEGLVIGFDIGRDQFGRMHLIEMPASRPL